MAEASIITTECVDDIPLLLTWMERMGVSMGSHEHFPPHRNWPGLDSGRVLVGWLAPMVSEADHRLNQVEGWAAERLETLSSCVGSADAEFQRHAPRRAVNDDCLVSIFDALGNGRLSKSAAEVLLRAFKDILLRLVQIGRRSYRYITPLSELQRKI